MIGDRSRAWWQHFSAAGVLLALASCSSESLPKQEPLDMDEPGALQGELAVYIADYDDGTTETRYFLRDAQGVEQRLAIKGEFDATPGKKLKIWGQQRGDRLEVAKYKVVEEAVGDIGSQAQRAQRSELIDAAAKPGSVMCAALINLDGGTAKTTVASVKSSFHSGSTSVDAYYRENSFGQVGLGGDAFGPYTYTGFGSCGYDALATSIRPMINTDASAKSITCKQYAFVFGPGGGCGWSGLGQVGTSDKPASDTWYADSVSCVVAVQEPGHNYGMQHSSSITCSGGVFADDPSSCTHSEYGDKYDTMGGGCYHMNAWQKLYEKWFAGCNGVRTTSSGKFNLYPLESPCNGVQVLQVPFPGAKTRTFQSTTLTSYYLELRTATGFDSKYGLPSVLIHVGGAPILPNQSNPQGLHTWALAAGGSTWGLAAGGSFADPAGGLTISVDSVDTTHAVVNIAYTTDTGSPVCLDGGNTAFTPPGASDCNQPPPPTPDAGSTGGTGGTGGKGGAAGTGGTAGKGGAAGTGGTGGTGGTTGGTAGTGGTTGGTGGTGGTAGKAGSGGTAGTGGATGGTGGTGGTTGGSGGTGGTTGGTGGTTGGTGGTGGTTGGTGGSTGGKGGSSGGGQGGTTGGGNGGASGRPQPPGDPGCGCRVTPAPIEGGGRGAMLALGLGALITARRRSRRKSDS